MGLGGCYACMKYLYVFLNIIFLIFAIAGIGGATWMFIEPTFSLQFTQESNDYLISVVIILIASIILLIVAILGIYSALREVRWILVLCFSLLLIIVVAEISAGVWAYLNRDVLEAQIRSSVKNTVQNEYHQDEKVRDLFDTIQEKLHCCGAEKPTDWRPNSGLNLAVTAVAANYDIPRSCCREGISQTQCTTATSGLKDGREPNYDVVYDHGCYTLILAKLRESASIILGVGGAILAVQLLGLILSLILAFTMNRSNRYKA